MDHRYAAKPTYQPRPVELPRALCQTDSMIPSERIFRLKIELNDWQPPIWRRVEVPATASLKALHDVIQAVMLFDDCHLYEFRVQNKRYAVPDPEWNNTHDRTYSAKTTKLSAFVERDINELAYTYDFGDAWRFTITVESKAEADPAAEYPCFVDGRGRAPPEDVGGLSGFETFLEAINDPTHEERADLMRWYGGPFSPTDISATEITGRTVKLARRRTVGKAAFEKSRNKIR
jgi:hypothetical protein